MTTPSRTTPSENPFAVITGASSGIGYELARKLAERGYDLLLIAEDDGIERAAATLRRDGTNQVAAVRADLAGYDGVEHAYAEIAATGRPVDVLALNAGRGIGGAFVAGSLGGGSPDGGIVDNGLVDDGSDGGSVDGGSRGAAETDVTELRDELNVIAVNVTSTVHLAKRLLPAMVARGSGRVLVTSSIASTMPGTYQAVYNASKSFVQSFAEALRAELKSTGVTVTALMPGPTDTNFFERAEMLDTRVGAGAKDDPAQVAEQGIEAMFKGEEKVLAGSLGTRAQAVAGKVLPDRAKAAMHGRMAEPGGA